jgi:predicted PurR-regulated permease PerM
LIFVIFATADALVTEMSKLLDLGGLTYIQIQASNFSGTINSIAEMYLPAQAANYVKGIGDIPTALILTAQPVLQSRILNLASNIPIYFIQFLLAIIFTYYFLVDGKRIVCEFAELLPEKKVTGRFLVELNLIYGSLFRVFFLTTLIVGILGAIVFLVLGVPYPLLLGMVIAVVALVPMVGPEMVFGPIALYYLLTQDYTRGIALLVFGIIFLTIIPNNFILPRLASASGSIHPLITLMAFTAPVFVIGLIGVVVGPAIFGFILAAYRTMVYFRRSTFDDESTASSMHLSKSL